ERPNDSVPAVVLAAVARSPAAVAWIIPRTGAELQRDFPAATAQGQRLGRVALATSLVPALIVLPGRTSEHGRRTDRPVLAPARCRGLP
ncbi:hypothetical protein ABTK20_21020, partial [Acinetobacter baumannii]